MNDVDDNKQGEMPDASDDQALHDGQAWTTVGDLGNKLPVAVGSVDFAFKPQNLQLALERGRRLDHKLRQRPADFMAHHLGMSLATLQGRSMDGLDPSEAALRVRSLPWTSVMYLIIRHWMDRNGRDTLTQDDVRCPNPSCGKMQDAVLHLSGMRVRSWGVLQDLPQLDVELLDGLPFPKADTVAAVVTVEPAPWNALCDLGSGQLQSEGEMTSAVLSAAIVGVDTLAGKRVNVTANALGALTGRDCDALDMEHALLCGGPVMALGVPCKRCQRDIWVPVPWTSLGFTEAPGTTPRKRTLRRR